MEWFCSWLIELPNADDLILITFLDLDILEPGTNVFVYDGENMNSTLLAAKYQLQLNYPLVSSGNKVLIHFTSVEFIHTTITIFFSLTYQSIKGK